MGHFFFFVGTGGEKKRSAMFYSLGVFNKKGTCVYFSEWNRPPSDATKISEDQHLMYGMLWSMKLFCTKMSPNPEERTELHCFRTSNYKLHFYESGTGVKLVAITDPLTADLHETLATIYRDVYVEFVIKNPFLSLEDPEPINCDLFSDSLNRFITAHSSFRS